MPYCPDCGREVDADWAACPDCGHHLNGADTGQGDPEQATGSVTVGDYPAATWGNGRKAAVLGTILAAFAAFLPWITVEFAGSTLTRTGVDAGAGFETLVFAALGSLVTAWRWGPWQRGFVGLVGALFGGYAYIYTTDPFFGVENVPNLARQYEYVFQAGPGLYLTGAAGILVLGGVLYDSFFSRS